MKNIGRLGGAKRNLIIINMDNKKDKRVVDHGWKIDNISITVTRQVQHTRIEQIRFSIIDKLFKI
jgi:hypothetical protein